MKPGRVVPTDVACPSAVDVVEEDVVAVVVDLGGAEVGDAGAIVVVEDDAAVEVTMDDGRGGVLVEELQRAGAVQRDAQPRLPWHPMEATPSMSSSAGLHS